MGVFDTLSNKLGKARKKISDAQKKREIKQLKKRKRQFKRDEIELQELKQKAKIEKQKASIRKSRRSGRGRSRSTSYTPRKLDVRGSLGMSRRAPKAIDSKPQRSSDFNPITGRSGGKKKKKDVERDFLGNVRPPGFF